MPARTTFIVLLCFLCQGCIVSTAVGVASDVAVAAVKVPIKVGGAVVDAAIPDNDDDESNDKE